MESLSYQWLQVLTNSDIFPDNQALHYYHTFDVVEQCLSNFLPPQGFMVKCSVQFSPVLEKIKLENYLKGRQKCNEEGNWFLHLSVKHRLHQ